MAGRPRRTLGKIEALLKRAEGLLGEFDAIVPTIYRERAAGPGDDPVSEAWHWFRQSLANATADLSWLRCLLQGKLSAAAAIAPAGAEENRSDAGDAARGGASGASSNEHRPNRGALRRRLHALSLWPEFIARVVQLREQAGVTIDAAWRTAETEYTQRLGSNVTRSERTACDSPAARPAADRPGGDGTTRQIATPANHPASDPDDCPILMAELLWVYDNIGNSDVSPDDAPNEYAGCILEGVRKDARRMREPWRIFADTRDEGERIVSGYRSRVARANHAGV